MTIILWRFKNMRIGFGEGNGVYKISGRRWFYQYVSDVPFRPSHVSISPIYCPGIKRHHHTILWNLEQHRYTQFLFTRMRPLGTLSGVESRPLTTILIHISPKIALPTSTCVCIRIHSPNWINQISALGKNLGFWRKEFPFIFFCLCSTILLSYIYQDLIWSWALDDTR